MVAPMEASQIFPPMVVSMVQVGEETGQLPDMLTKVADVFEDEVDTAVAGLTSLLEPLMIVVLALIVGTIVLAGAVSAIALWRNPAHLVARIFFGVVALFSVVMGLWLAMATGSRGSWVIGGSVALLGALALWRVARRGRQAGASANG